METHILFGEIADVSYNCDADAVFTPGEASVADGWD